jgi:methylated-DNA-protein-cysteine methyltransferase-like protein
MKNQSDFADDVAAVLNQIPPGQVMTYSEVAAEAGHPGAYRAVGSFLRTNSGYPWWRVVTTSGRLVPGHERDHLRLLSAEGIRIHDGRVVMARHHSRPSSR